MNKGEEEENERCSLFLSFASIWNTMTELRKMSSNRLVAHKP